VYHTWQLFHTYDEKNSEKSAPVELSTNSMSSIISCEEETLHSTKNVMSSNINLKMENIMTGLHLKHSLRNGNGGNMDQQ